MTKMSWSGITIKYLLFIFNLLFVITGIIILSVGVSIKATYNTYETFLEQKYFSAPNLLIAIGTIIFIIAFFGCCGACKQNYCMIITFSSLLCLIFVLEFAAGISGYVLKNETADYLNKTMYDDIEKYKPNTKTEITLIWDAIQKEFDCCGVQDYNDWLHAEITNHSLPLSCCSIPVGAIGGYNCTNEPKSPGLKTKGCAEQFGNFVRTHSVTIGSVGLGFAFIQILGIIFSCHLAKKVRESYEYM